MSENKNPDNPQQLAADSKKSSRQAGTSSRAISPQPVTQEVEYEHLKGLRDHYANKQTWSVALLTLLTGTLGLQWALIFLVGFGVLDFTQYKWLLPTLLVQTLMQVASLAFIVVKSLFR